MTSLTLHNLDDAVRNRLRDLAVVHGRSIEDEASRILREAVLCQPPAAPGGEGAGKLGSRIAARFAEAGLPDGIPELRGRVATPPTLER